LSVAAIHDSLRSVSEEHRAANFAVLTEVAKAQDPRKAAELVQEFALSKADMGASVDDSTRQQLIAIRDMLTNETYIALEQAHRRDQDLLNKHARAINECGVAHVKHLQQDVEGLEVNLVLTSKTPCMLAVVIQSILRLSFRNRKGTGQTGQG